ncbi:MAG: tetratricopeptide repeat protein [Phycisphaerales bacterium]
MSETGSNWYTTESTLLEELRRLKPAARGAPEIPGYEEIRELRRGGQGVVYTAVQRSTRRRTAIKVLLDSAADPAGRRRFEREVDLVASLRHPRIVSVYDSGVTADGRPFLVMEYVDGQPLDEFWSSRGWTKSAAHAGEVVDMIARVAEAVEHAHQRGVIHRDLKPSNIRVDAAGEPRVLDFGLAKVLGASGAPGAGEGEEGVSSSAETLTLSGQFMGSLAWASPEQAAGDGSAVDVRSDVYSLGIVLYHGLTRTFPYDVTGGLRATLDRVATAPPARASRHAEWINDELDTIVLKCLSKDPGRRYQSAGELARDLRRFLAGEPVLAKADSAWYTIRAAVRRHRAMFASAAALAVMLGCSSVVLAMMYARARDAETFAQEEALAAKRSEERARQESAEKAATAEFLRHMLSTPDPTVQGREVRVVDVLDRAARQLRGDAGMSAAVRASLAETLAATYGVLGRYEQAEALTIEALELKSALAGPAHAETLELKRSLAVLKAMRGDLAAGEAMVREVIEAAEALSAEERATLNARQSLGEVLYFQGKMGEAEETLRRALADQQAAPDAAPDKWPQVIASLGIVLRNQNKSAEAADLLASALAQAKERFPRLSGVVIKITNSYASALHDLDRWSEAEGAYREALAAALEAVGEDHSDTITILSNLGQLYTDQGRHSDAEGPMMRALEASKRTYGPEHPTTLLVMNNAAKLLQNLGRLGEALPIMRACVEGRVKVLGPQHGSTLIAQANLANMMFESGEREAALEIERGILATRLERLGEKNFDTIISLNSVGMMLTRLDRAEEGLAFLERCTAAADALLGAEHSHAGLFRANTGRCLRKLGRLNEAEARLRSALSVLEAKLGAEEARTKQTREDLAGVLRSLGREDEASALESKSP